MRILLLLFACGVALNGFAQGTVLPPNVRAQFTIDRLLNISPNEIAYGLPMAPKELTGDGYLDVNWRPGSLLLYNSERTIEGYPLRYDLLRQEMEIKSSMGVKVLKSDQIKTFVWIDSVRSSAVYFVNARDFAAPRGERLTGFLQVLSDGKIGLVKHTAVVIIKADYNLQFNTGHRNDRIVKRQSYYWLQNNHLTRLTPAKKSLLRILSDRGEQIDSFIKSNGLEVKNEYDLQRIFDYYNSLK